MESSSEAQGQAVMERPGAPNGQDSSYPRPPQRVLAKPYRHVAVIHSVQQTSCLSHDAQAAPSFLGFRNLMVLVLGASAPRLMLFCEARPALRPAVTGYG